MSSQSGRDIHRRIPENLGGTDTIFDNAPIVGTVQVSDGFVAFGPALIVLFISQNFLPPGLTIIGFLFGGLTAMIGMMALLAKPQYLTLGDWISDIRRFRKEPDTYRKALPSGKTDTGDSIEVNSDRDTRTKINIEKIYPQSGVAERPDDSVIGMFRIHGLNLDSASPQILNQKIQQFDSFVNQNLQEDIQLYMPMRQFDPDNQIEMYKDRLEDSKVIQNDPLLQEYISDRISFMTAMGLGSYLRDFYVIVEVPRREVLTEEAEAAEMKRVLEQFPPGNLFANLYILYKGRSLTMMNEDELKSRQIERVVDRRNELAQQIESSIGTRTEPLDADEVGVVMKEFWEGVHVNENEKEGFIRENPYVKGEQDIKRINSSDSKEET